MNQQKHDTKATSRSTLINYLSAVLELGVFVFHIIASRFFGKTAYGAYVFAYSIIELSGKVGLMGFDKSLLKTVAAERVKQNKDGEIEALVTAFRTVMITSLVMMAGLVVFSDPIAKFNMEDSLGFSLKILSPMVLFWSGMMTLVAATMATRTMRYNLIIRGVLNPMVMLLSLGFFIGLSHYVNLGEHGIIVAQVLAGFIVLLLSIKVFSYCFNLKEITKKFWKSKTNWHLVRYSIPIGFAELLNQALARLDVILLGFFLKDPLMLANYGAIILLSNSISSVRFAFDPVLSPIVSEAIETGNMKRLEENLKRMVRWVSFLAIPFFIVMAALGDSILSLWGASYVQAYPALVVLAFGHLFNAMFGLNQWPVVISGRSKLDLINNIIVFIVNLVLNLWFIPLWGMLGSAIATGISRVLLRSLQIVEVYYFLRIHAFSFALFKLVISGILSLSFILAIKHFVSLSFLMMGSVGIIGLLLYGGFVLILGLTPDDQDIISGVKNKLFRLSSESK